jgi:hypothetical protein
MTSFCERLRQFFHDVQVKKSCVSSCCNTIIEKEHKHKHHHKHKHKEETKEKPIENLVE